MHHRPVGRCYADLLASLPVSERLDIADKLTLRSRLESHPNPIAGSACKVWTADRSSSGYGILRVAGMPLRAHRLAWVLDGRYDPNTLVLDHVCRVRECINVAHLELVTAGTNVLRGTGPSAENARKLECIRGRLFAGANLYVYPNGDRGCRACREFHARRYKAIARAKAAA